MLMSAMLPGVSEGDRLAVIIGQAMDFRGAAATRAPDRLRPFPFRAVP
jgi:hypothetical protein